MTEECEHCHRQTEDLHWQGPHLLCAACLELDL